ncbi:MAG TPA: hypothetical protein VJ476_04680 [Rhizomicrobium sp.]|jgi:hypothetical protein|nr:hypothetical protein [Rhizomicrobium sp.]
MRKRTLYGIAAIIGALVVYVFAYTNWLLALIVGAGVGVTILLVIHSYPNDIAPPADRRHENTQRRKGVKV